MTSKPPAVRQIDGQGCGQKRESHGDERQQHKDQPSAGFVAQPKPQEEQGLAQSVAAREPAQGEEHRRIDADQQARPKGEGRRKPDQG